jgi:hypothetical protein
MFGKKGRVTARLTSSEKISETMAEQAGILWPVLKAVSEGKTVQYRSRNGNEQLSRNGNEQLHDPWMVPTSGVAWSFDLSLYEWRVAPGIKAFSPQLDEVRGNLKEVKRLQKHMKRQLFVIEQELGKRDGAR